MSRSRVYLDVTIGTEPAGRLTIELFSDKTPKTCENFRALCNGSDPALSYRLCPFHRIIDEFMVQGGDITNGDGTGGDSIYGGEFEDENLDWRELDAPGLVCMANRGRGTNSSQFFITLEPCTHLNGKHTIFGHLVSGQDTLARMAKVNVDSDDRPREPVLIARCGELERRKKAAAPNTAQIHDEGAVSAPAANRGRRRTTSRSHSRSVSRQHDSPEATKRRSRRPSDGVVDETLRGRPKRRSESGSRSKTRRGPDDDGSQSPLPKHKRKRSPSPMGERDGIERQHDGAGDDGDGRGQAEGGSSPKYRRRRRSLPNQYHDDMYQRRGRDWDRERERDRERYDDRERDERERRDGTRHDRDHDRSDGRRYPPRGNDSYRGQGQRYNGPRYRDERFGRLDDGRLGGDGGGGEGEGQIKFKGRGSMKFREVERRW